MYLSTDGGPGQQTLTVTRVAGSETAALTAQVSPQPVPAARRMWKGAWLVS